MSYESRYRVPEAHDKQVPGGRKAAGLFHDQDLTDMSIHKLAPDRTLGQSNPFSVSVAFQHDLCAVVHWRRFIGRQRPSKRASKWQRFSPMIFVALPEALECPRVVAH